MHDTSTTDVAKPNPEKWQAYLGRTAHRAMPAAPIGGDRPCPTTGLLPDALGIWPLSMRALSWIDSTREAV